MENNQHDVSATFLERLTESKTTRAISIAIASALIVASCSASGENSDVDNAPEIEITVSSPDFDWTDKYPEAEDREFKVSSVYLLPHLSIQELELSLYEGNPSVMKEMFFEDKQNEEYMNDLYDRFSRYAGGKYSTDIEFNDPPEVLNDYFEGGYAINEQFSEIKLAGNVIIRDELGERADEQWVIFSYSSISFDTKDVGSWRVTGITFLEDD